MFRKPLHVTALVLVAAASPLGCGEGPAVDATLMGSGISADVRDLRQSGSYDGLDCTLFQTLAIAADDGATEHGCEEGAWHCELDPADAGGVEGISLPLDGLSEALKEKVRNEGSSGRVKLRATRASTKNLRIIVPENVRQELGPKSEPREQGARTNGQGATFALAPGDSTATVLVVKVIALDDQIGHSLDEIHRNIFGGFDDQVNLASRYDACSYGKRRMVPAEGEHIYDGVIEANIPINVSGASRTTCRTAAESVVAGLVGSLNQFDHILYVCPPATDFGGAAAVACKPGRWTAYDGAYYAHVLVHSHEVGHNLGLHHSGYNGVEYGDNAGYMGAKLYADEAPKSCFNASKSAELHWYDDRLQELDHRASSSWTGNLIGVADYGVSTENETVVLKVPQPLTGNGNAYFLTYNRKKGITSETQAFGDRVTIVQSKPGAISWVVATLVPGETYVAEAFDGTDVDLTFSALSAGTTAQGADYVRVSVLTNQAPGQGSGQVSEGKHATQSSTPYGTSGVASNAVDGDTDGRWTNGSVTHTSSQSHAWWEVDLGAPHDVSGVTLWNRTDCCSDRLANFHVDLLDADGAVLTTINYPGTAGTKLDLDVSASGVFAARVQLNGTGILSLAEVQIWGSLGQTSSDCGDGTCNNNEDCGSCPNDCGVCGAPGLLYGTVSGDINTTAVNPATAVTTSLSETEDAIAANTTEIYTGIIYDADGNISFTEDNDDRTRLYIDGTLVLSSDYWADRVSTGNLRLAPGWHSFELRISNGGGPGGRHTSPGFGFDPDGGTNWVHPSDPGDGSLFQTSSTCGDGTCSNGEDCGSCAADCGACEYCGDGTCNNGEDCGSCAGDCGACEYCGDGTCNNGEDCGSCAGDCGSCGLSSVDTTYADNNKGKGNMFDIVAGCDLTVASFDVHALDAGTVDDFEVYYRMGSYVGHETDISAWTLAASAAGVTSYGGGVPTPLNLGLDIQVPPGETIAFHVFSPSGARVRYTNGTAVGNVVVDNGDLRLLEGAGTIGVSGPIFFTPRIFNGTVHYRCSE